MKCFVCGCVLVVLAVCGPGRATGQKQTEDDQLYGTWVVVSVKDKGETKPIPKGDFTVTFAKGGVVTMKNKGVAQKPATFTVDAGKSPKEINLVVDPTAKDAKESPGIYKIEEDTLTLAYVLQSADAKRPTSFDAKEAFILTMKRRKP